MTTSINLTRPLLLVGCGKMGGAMLDGWLRLGVSASLVTIIEPHAAACASFVARGVKVVPDFASLETSLAPAVIILAVKPQSMSEILASAAKLAMPDTLVLSIAAGKRIAFFAQAFGVGQPIIRAMPNTPAAVGRGMTVLVATSTVTPAIRQLAEQLCSAVGAVGWVEDEALLDAVTALSGGGPAYVFLMIETLAKVGIEAGLPVDLATSLARETVIGSGELARLSSESADQLRRNVTSLKGTTERALEVLMAGDGLHPLFNRAIAAAIARASELAD